MKSFAVNYRIPYFPPPNQKHCMRNLLFLPLLLASAGARAQTPADSSRPMALQASATFRPLYTLNGTELARYPATNFMELVNGAFPFVATETIRTQDYSFIVDGALLLNPQSLNISQITSIAFYPQGTGLLQGAAVGRGTFVVRTVTGEKGLRASLRAGALLSSESAEPPFNSGNPSTPYQRRNATYGHAELTYGTSIGKALWSSALSYTRLGAPTYLDKQPSQSMVSRGGGNRVRFSNFVEVPLAANLRLQAALLGTWQSGKLGSDRLSNINIQHRNEKEDAMNLGAHAGIEYTGDRFFSAFRASADFTDDKINADVESYNPFFPIATLFESRLHTRRQLWSLWNTTGYRIVRSKEMNLETALQAHYVEQTYKDSSDYMSNLSPSGPGTFGNGSYYRLKTTRLQLIPALRFSWRSILQAEAELVYDRVGDSFLPDRDKRDSLLPHGALRFNATPLLRGGVLSCLELGTDYRKRRLEEAPGNLLTSEPERRSPYYFIPDIFAETWTHHLHIGFAQDRLLLAFEWIESDETRGTLDPSIGYNGYFIELIPQPFRRSGTGIALRGEILRKTHLSWTLQASAYQDRYTLKGASNQQWTDPADINIDLYPKRQWRTGLQTAFRYKAVHLQATALGLFNDHGFMYNNKVEYYDNISLTNLVAGVTLDPKQGPFAAVELDLQARNLPRLKAAMNYAYRFPYVGIGVQARFR
jgi:hypothetical protein